MKTQLRTPSSSLFVELLEPRIAPAVLVAGETSKDYSDAEFIPMDSPEADPAIAFFFSNSPDHYYLPFKKGDVLLFDHDANAATAGESWVQVKSGSGYLFFYDRPDGENPGDGQITKDELTGISFGGAVSIIVNGDIHGSVVTNVNGANNAFLGNTLAEYSKNFFTDLQVTGNVEGSVFSAGNITKGSILSVTGLYTGNAGAAVPFQLGGGAGVGGGAIESYDMPVAKAGSNISNFTVHGNANFVMAGDGGASGAGGKISNVKILGNTGDLTITGGDGGDGIASKMNGGAGGSLTGVDIKAADAVLDGTVIISSGSGGDGLLVSATKAGNGGAGGAIDKVTVGASYDAKTRTWAPDSGAGLMDLHVLVQAGSGGAGKIAGAGGSISNFSAGTHDSSIEVWAGTGGSGLDVKAPKAGIGGSLNNIFAVALDSGIMNSSLMMGGGNGGHYLGDTNIGPGAKGGSVSNVLGVAAQTVGLFGGFGSSGTTGGHGGAILKVTANTPWAEIASLQVMAGIGGNATTGAGGNGGTVDSLLFGCVYNAKLKRWEPLPDLLGDSTAEVWGGYGGAGKSGGAGGSILNSAVFTRDSSLGVFGGTGGAVTDDYADTKGTKGGNGGMISNMSAVSLATDPNLGSQVSLNSGSGGTGGNAGTGGNGGAISKINALGGMQINIFAGSGGDGAVGGSGGALSSIHADTPFTPLTSILVQAGNGGLGGVTSGGAGGAITNLNVDNAYYVESLTGHGKIPSGANSAGYLAAPGDITVTKPSTGLWFSGGYYDGEQWVDPVHGSVTINAETFGDVEISGRIEGDLTINQNILGRLIFEEGAEIGGDLLVNANADFGIFVRTFDLDTSTIIYTPYTPGDHPEIVQGASTIAPQVVKTIENWQDEIFDLEVRAGTGGEGITAGGAGGAISQSEFTVESSGFNTNPGREDATWQIQAGAGGQADIASATSKGGNGGAISRTWLYGFARGSFEVFTVTSGQGGSGGALGGAGGNLDTVTAMVSNDVLSEDGPIFLAGSGGDADDTKGKGGIGGNVSGANMEFLGENQLLTLNAGEGGEAGATGGAGGSLINCTLKANTLQATAGAGGFGDTTIGAGGAVKSSTMGFGAGGMNITAGSGSSGGNIEAIKVGASHGDGVVLFQGGNALSDSRSGNGGTIKGIELSLANDAVYNTLSFGLFAGSGSAGGHGGNVENISDKIWGFSGPDPRLPIDLVPANYNLTIHAGQGSSNLEQTIAGKGGSVKNVKLVAPAETFGFIIIAGSSVEASKGGMGGNVENVTLLHQTTAFEKGWSKGKPTVKPLKAAFPADTQLGFSVVSTGNGGDSIFAALGGKGGDAKNILWNTPWNIDALARNLNLGAGGMGTTGNGPDGKAIKVVPDPNAP